MRDQGQCWDMPTVFVVKEYRKKLVREPRPRTSHKKRLFGKRMEKDARTHLGVGVRVDGRGRQGHGTVIRRV